MIERSEIERFLNKRIAVGIPHNIISGRLFFYFGILKYVDDLEVKIETNNGYKIIPLTNILDIHEAQGGKNID